MTRPPRSVSLASLALAPPSLPVRLGVRLGVVVALGLAACHPTEAPPIPPPKPTNPTNYAFRAPFAPESGHPGGAFGGSRVAALPVEIIDASIVLDGSVGWDAARFELDAGTFTPPEPPGLLTTNGVSPR